MKTELDPRFFGRLRPVRRRFLAVAVAGLAVLGAVMGVTYAGNTGTTNVTVGGGSSAFVYPVSNGASLPAGTNFVNSLKYTASGSITSSSGTSSIGTATLPSWIPTANTAGSVTSAGDLALIDATSSGIPNTLLVNVYITNLAALQLDYSSFALPFNVYWSNCTAGSCTWSAANGQGGNPSVVTSAPAYLTNADGTISFNLPAGHYYDIVLDTGGSFYNISTTASGGALAPTFFFSAQAT